MTIDGALLLAIALLLPFRLLPFGARVLRLLDPGRPRGSPPELAAATSTARSVALFLSIGLLISAIFGLSDGRSAEGAAMIGEVEQLKAKMAQLESFLLESQDALNYKTFHLQEKDKVVKEMEKNIMVLQNDLHEIKDGVMDLLHTEKRIRTLEAEVQYLSDQSRKNIESINILDSLADDAKEKLGSSTTEAEKLESIITEQWIQIQQLEQAFQLTKIMAARVLNRNSHSSHDRSQTPSGHIWTKVQQFIRNIGGQKLTDAINIPDSFFLGAFSWSCISQLQKVFESIMLLVQNFHIELQELIRNTLEMNEFTASVSNEFVVNILAYAIMALPLISGWIALLFFSEEEEDF